MMLPIYKLVKKRLCLANKYGKCVSAREIIGDSKNSKHNHKNKPIKWVCILECKIPPDEVHAIVNLKESSDKPIQELRQALDGCNSGCPNQHFALCIRYDNLPPSLGLL